MQTMMNKTNITLYKQSFGNITIKGCWNKNNPFKLLWKIYRNGKLLKDNLPCKPNMAKTIILYGDNVAHNKFFR